MQPNELYPHSIDDCMNMTSVTTKLLQRIKMPSVITKLLQSIKMPSVITKLLVLIDRVNTQEQYVRIYDPHRYNDMLHYKCKLEKKMGQMVRGKPTPDEIEEVLIDYRYTFEFKPSDLYWKAFNTLDIKELSAFYKTLGK